MEWGLKVFTLTSETLRSQDSVALRKPIILFKISPEDRNLFPSMWKTLSVLKAFIDSSRSCEGWQYMSHMVHQLGYEREHILTNFMDCTKPGEAADTLAGRAVIRRDCSGLECCARRSLKKFHQVQTPCSWDEGIPRTMADWLEAGWLGAALQKKTWGPW